MLHRLPFFFAARNIAQRWFLVCLFSLSAIQQVIAQDDVLSSLVAVPTQRTTLYEAFNLISMQTGCMFVYDSQVVNSDKKIRLEAAQMPLRQLLDRLLANPRLKYKVIGRHILIYRQQDELPQMPVHAAVTKSSDSLRFLIIKGHVYDNRDKKPIPYSSIGIMGESIGTVANEEGFFIMKVPARYAGSNLTVSHIGFFNQNIPLKLLDEQKVDIYLDRRIISIQEVIIQYIDPAYIIRKAVENRDENYSMKPVYLTSFYREGVQKNDRSSNYLEAVFRVYKSPFDVSEYQDQVKLLKSRKLENQAEKDTVFLKLKGGILSGLQLDIVKVLPDFLDPQLRNQYVFSYSDIVSNDVSNAYEIGFEQRDDVDDPLYKGLIHVNRENFAILGAEFEVNPRYLNKAIDALVVHKSRRVTVKLEKISYSISYREFNGKYYLNHARCDIRLKTRLRNRLSSDSFSTFLETATCVIDTLDVERFPKQETIKPSVVFSDVSFKYDESFWGDYNIIAPEAKLGDALSRIIGRLEQIE